MDQQDIIKYTCTCKVKTKKEEKVCGNKQNIKRRTCITVPTCKLE